MLTPAFAVGARPMSRLPGRIQSSYGGQQAHVPACMTHQRHGSFGTSRHPPSMRLRRCDTHLGGNILPPGMRVTYRTRESALGLFADREPALPQLDSALEMANRAEQQAARALERR